MQKTAQIFKNEILRYPRLDTVLMIEKTVKDAIQKTGAKEAKDFGRTMAEVMKSLKNKADAGAISEIIKKNLESLR